MRLQSLVYRHHVHAWLVRGPSCRDLAVKWHRRVQHGVADGQHWRSRRPAAVLGTPVQADFEAPQQSAAAHSQAGQRMSWEGRTADCGSVTPKQEGTQLAVCGWVHRHRNLGGVCFMDIRDSSGLLQVRFPARKRLPCLQILLTVTSKCPPQAN